MKTIFYILVITLFISCNSEDGNKIADVKPNNKNCYKELSNYLDTEKESYNYIEFFKKIDSLTKISKSFFNFPSYILKTKSKKYNVNICLDINFINVNKSLLLGTRLPSCNRITILPAIDSLYFSSWESVEMIYSIGQIDNIKLDFCSDLSMPLVQISILSELKEKQLEKVLSFIRESYFNYIINKIESNKKDLCGIIENNEINDYLPSNKIKIYFELPPEIKK